MKLRHALLVADTKYKKLKKYAQDESDLDAAAVVEHEEQCKAREIEKAERSSPRGMRNWWRSGPRRTRAYRG